VNKYKEIVRESQAQLKFILSMSFPDEPGFEKNLVRQYKLGVSTAFQQMQDLIKKYEGIDENN